MKNAVIYARGNDAIGISIPSQIFLCKRFAVNNNYTVSKYLPTITHRKK